MRGAIRGTNHAGRAVRGRRAGGSSGGGRLAPLPWTRAPGAGGMMATAFRDRTEAGQVLAEMLRPYAGRDDVIVLALPRGGVPVGFEVARALGAPLDVFVVRKLGVPGHEELAMGAIASGGICVLNDDAVEALRIPSRVIEAVAERELRELERRERAYRDGRPAPEVHG